MRPFLQLPVIAALAGLLAAANAVAGEERCEDRRIVRFGETTETIARRCGVTPGAIERQNPGLHIKGAKLGTRINVPRPALPSPRVKIHGNPAISGGNRMEIPVLR
jgi:hypothetical protein